MGFNEEPGEEFTTFDIICAMHEVIYKFDNDLQATERKTGLSDHVGTYCVLSGERPMEAEAAR